jgi:RNA polymerase sigma-70 factor (ECF subfamily)
VRSRATEISAEVIESCRQGDRSAFREVYEAHKDHVYSIALYYFHGNASVASDVTQQVFLKLMKDFHHFRGESAFSTWLYRLVVNTCVDATRRADARLVPMEAHVSETLAAPGSQEVDMAQNQIALAVRSAVSGLPPAFRAAILLRYFEDLSYEEMAKILNCSIGTVSSRLSRGHRLLAEKLSAIGGRLSKRNRDV